MNIINDFISLFFPEYCFTCHNNLVGNEKYICTQCVAELPKTKYYLSKNNPIHFRLNNVQSLQQATAYLKFIKSGKVQTVMHYYKYKNYPEIGTVLGRWFAQDLLQNQANFDWDLIVPVPLHPKKLKKRGYNQSEFFAKGLAEVLNIPHMPNIMIRKSHSDTQTRKSRIARWKNVEQIFSVVDKEQIKNKHVLLVDDVITTGATLEACALQLERHDTRAISVASLAQVE